MGYDAEVPAAATHQGGFTGAQALVSDDAECIDRVLRGDIERFSELIARHQRHVLKIVQGHVPADRVPEVAHDVFVRAYTGLSQYAGTVPFEHWLSRLSVRACYDFWRAHRRREVPVSGLTDDQVGWLDRALADASSQEFRDRADRQDALEVLEWALAQLSPEHRLVLTLVSLEGRSVREAADLLGWTAVNVKVRCYRARQALRTIFLREWERLRHDHTS